MEFTFATIAGGLGGGSIGAKQAGGTCLWNIDKDPSNPEISLKIGEAYVANLDSLHVHETVEDAVNLIKQKKLFLPVPDLLIITWSCKNFSIANLKAVETDSDLQGAKAISYLIGHFNSPYIIFENVPRWVKSKSWQDIIKPTLWKQRYYIDGEESPQNAWDFDVPQVRKRLIIRCSQSPILSLEPFKSISQGCIESVEDLIPNLPETELTQPQQSVLPEANCVIQRIGYSKAPLAFYFNEPIDTIRASLADDGKGGKRSQFYTICYKGEFKNVTPEVLLRWQGFPDHTQLPEDIRYAVRGIGNAVPPPMMKAAVESLSIKPNNYSFVSYFSDPSPQIETVSAIWQYRGCPPWINIFLRNGIVPLALNPSDFVSIDNSKAWDDTWFAAQNHPICYKDNPIFSLLETPEDANSFKKFDVEKFCHINPSQLPLFSERIQHWEINYYDKELLIKNIPPESLIYIEVPRNMSAQSLEETVSLFHELPNTIVVNVANFRFDMNWRSLNFHYETYSKIAFKNVGKNGQDAFFIRKFLQSGQPIIDVLLKIPISDGFLKL